jgi:hypothetical protein
MKGYWTDLFSYVMGVIREPDLTYLAMVADAISSLQVPA